MNPDDWDLQCIIWREDPNDVLQEYWLTVVTFGMSSAPHCAVRAMQQCASDHKLIWPNGARAMIEDFFVDDCITGAGSVEAAENLRHEMQHVLSSGGFELAKWRSNSLEFLDVNDRKDVSGCDLTKDTTVLGLKWFPDSDELAFKVRN